MDNSLTIEVMDLIKSRGGKTTVWKELALLNPPEMEKTPWYRKTPEVMDEEPQHGLKSAMFHKEWFIGWNNAECDMDEDPIPFCIPTGTEMGPNMLHAWLNKPPIGADNWIPFTGHLEDLVGAGHLSDYNGGVQVGFKKLYLKQADKELGTKMLLERRADGSDRDNSLFGAPILGFGTPQGLGTFAQHYQSQQATVMNDLMHRGVGGFGAGKGSSSLSSTLTMQDIRDAQDRARGLTNPPVTVPILSAGNPLLYPGNPIYRGDDDDEDMPF
jgi:hypothetical protein